MRKIALLLSLVILGGCGVVQNARLNSAANEAQLDIANQCSPLAKISVKEMSVMISNKADFDKCSLGMPDPLPRDKIVEMGKCVDDIFYKKIAPVTYSKSNLTTLLKEKKKIREMYAKGDIDWETFSKSISESITKYLDKGTTGSYFSSVSCGNDIIRAKVMPAYSDALKPLLMQYMTDALSFSRQADKTKMAWEDFNIGIQRLWSEFATKEQSAIASNQAQQAQAWQKFGNAVLNTQAQQTQNQNSSPCAFNPSNNSYQQCYHFNAIGQCLHYGAVCNP